MRHSTMTHYDDFRTHRRSRRLASYDYAAEGWYFVTIGTEHCRSYFGTIRNGIMGLNEMGCIAHSCWTKIPDHIRDVGQGAFIVMRSEERRVGNACRGRRESAGARGECRQGGSDA